MSPRLALLAITAVGALLLSAPSAAEGPTAPLSTLGPLQPAPHPGPLGPELIPIPKAAPLAPAWSAARIGKPVSGIRCERNPKLVFHHHAHLNVFVNGKPRRIPYGIGIWPPLGPENFRFGQFGITKGNCFSWLSTHYADGVIHTEASVRRSFVLGQFFDVWGQPLSRTRVGPARGRVTALVNGRVWTGDPRRIPLLRHTLIQLEVGKPLVAFQPVTFHGSF